MKACFENKNETLLDDILINRPNSFQKTVIMETAVSDCHKLATTIFRSTYLKLPPKTMRYIWFKPFSKQDFVHEFDKKLIKGDIYETDD